MSDLIDRLDDIGNAIIYATKKPILVAIDDLDKLDLELTKKIFSNINPLFQPQFRIIYTIPIAVMRDVPLRSIIRNKTNNKVATMRVAKFFPKEACRDLHAVPLEEPRNVFAEILYRRISPDLIEPEVAQAIILNSGGVLRELIRLASQCCDRALAQIRRESRKPLAAAKSPRKINAAIFAEALADIRIEFAEPLGQLDFTLLKAIYDQNDPPDAESQRFLDLLHGLYVLEYRNDDLWYDLHPIVKDLLKRKGIISDGQLTP